MFRFAAAVFVLRRSLLRKYRPCRRLFGHSTHQRCAGRLERLAFGGEFCEPLSDASELSFPRIAAHNFVWNLAVGFGWSLVTYADDPSMRIALAPAGKASATSMNEVVPSQF